MESHRKCDFILFLLVIFGIFIEVTAGANNTLPSASPMPLFSQTPNFLDEASVKSIVVRASEVSTSPTPSSSTKIPTLEIAVAAPTSSHTPAPSIPGHFQPGFQSTASAKPSNTPTKTPAVISPSNSAKASSSVRVTPSTSVRVSISPPVRGTIWPKKSTALAVSPSTSKVYVRETTSPTEESPEPSVSSAPSPSTSRIYIRGTVWPKSASPSTGILDTASIPTPSASVSVSATATPKVLPPVQNRTNNGSVCFPSGATVKLSDGRNVRMENVEIGMRVLVAGGKYSDVYGFSHNKPDVWYKFVKISTADGELKLTHSHHVYTTDGVFAAKMLKAGDSLILGGTRKPSKIVRIGSSFEKGLYNPHTVSGSIVVDGFLASTYTSHFDGFAAQAALSPFRMAFKCGSNSNILGRFLQYGLYDIAQLIASNMP